METNVKKEDKFNRKVNLQDFEKNVDLSKLFKFKINLKVIQFSNTYIYINLGEKILELAKT